MNEFCPICDTQLIETPKQTAERYKTYHCPTEQYKQYLSHFCVGYRENTNGEWKWDGEDYVYPPYFIYKRKNEWCLGRDWDAPGVDYAFNWNDELFYDLLPNFNPKLIVLIKNKIESLEDLIVFR